MGSGIAVLKWSYTGGENKTNSLLMYLNISINTFGSYMYNEENLFSNILNLLTRSLRVLNVSHVNYKYNLQVRLSNKFIHFCIYSIFNNKTNLKPPE